VLSINQIKSLKQIAATQGFMREYLAWFYALVPGSESAPTFQGWEAEIAAFQASMLLQWDVCCLRRLMNSLQGALH
jgi:hypothetical protein